MLGSSGESAQGTLGLGAFCCLGLFCNEDTPKDTTLPIALTRFECTEEPDTGQGTKNESAFRYEYMNAQGQTKKVLALGLPLEGLKAGGIAGAANDALSRALTNCWLQMVRVNKARGFSHEIWLMTWSLAAGQEAFVDYGFSYWEIQKLPTMIVSRMYVTDTTKRHTIRVSAMEIRLLGAGYPMQPNRQHMTHIHTNQALTPSWVYVVCHSPAGNETFETWPPQAYKTLAYSTVNLDSIVNDQVCYLALLAPRVFTYSVRVRYMTDVFPDEYDYPIFVLIDIIAGKCEPTGVQAAVAKGLFTTRYGDRTLYDRYAALRF